MKDDYLFVDPPYTVKHNMNNFIKYNEHLFSWGDQERLRDVLFKAKKRGVKIVVCNADSSSIMKLYEGFGAYRSLARHSVLAGKAEVRRKTTEAMFITNI